MKKKEFLYGYEHSLFLYSRKQDHILYFESKGLADLVCLIVNGNHSDNLGQVSEVLEVRTPVMIGISPIRYVIQRDVKELPF